MKLFRTTLYAAFIIFFTSCGDNTENPLADVSHIEINEPSVVMHSTDTANFTATLTYTDSTTIDVTQKVTWNSSDLDVANISNGVVTAQNTGGDANVTISYQQLTALPSIITVIPLTSFGITNADINTTGSHILEAQGIFDDNSTKVIIKNIIWTADNSAIITVENDIATIAVIAGDTNVTATLFDDTNITSPIAPQTVTYTVVE